MIATKPERLARSSEVTDAAHIVSPGMGWGSRAFAASHASEFDNEYRS
jgi:hypothetical protein